MKKLINDPTTVVSDALAGIAAAHPELRVDHERRPPDVAREAALRADLDPHGKPRPTSSHASRTASASPEPGPKR